MAFDEQVGSAPDVDVGGHRDAVGLLRLGVELLPLIESVGRNDAAPRLERLAEGRLLRHRLGLRVDERVAEGCSLVFDIAAVAQMLKREGDARYWMWLMLKPVRYAGRPVDEIFPEMVFGSADSLRRFIDGEKVPEMPVSEFLMGTTLLKGASYKSEREVRIVAIPGTLETARHAAQEYPDEFDATLPLPNIKTRPDTSKRYVALFDGLGLRLPAVTGPSVCGARSKTTPAVPSQAAGVFFQLDGGSRRIVRIAGGGVISVTSNRRAALAI
jgi:hypothetical protein